MKTIAISIGLGLLVASGTALAAWSGQGVLLGNIEVDAAGTATPNTFLTFATVPSSMPPNCDSKSQGLVQGNADYVKTITSMATAAFLAGKTVRVNFNGCSTPVGSFTYPIVTGLMLLP